MHRACASASTNSYILISGTEFGCSPLAVQGVRMCAVTPALAHAASCQLYERPQQVLKVHNMRARLIQGTVGSRQT